jgi:hypothetical protein
MKPNETAETTALLDAVTKANEELAEIGVGDFIAVMIFRQRKRSKEDVDMWTAYVVNGAGITLHRAVGVSPRCAGNAAVDWVCLDFIPRPPSVTPLGECRSVDPRLRKP